MASGAINSFITAPFLIHRLGQTTYGLWILIASLTNYLNLIDLGLRASTTRQIAFFRSRDEQEIVNSILSTAQSILATAAVVAVIATFILVELFPRFSDVPADQMRSGQVAITLSGLTVAMILAMSIFDATLWAYERFDLINSIEIAADFGQTACLLFFVWRGGSLVTVAAIVMVGTFLIEAVKGVACFKIDPQLRIRLANVNAWASRQLFGFALWRSVWTIGTRATSMCGPLIIGARLSAKVVTPYSVASRLDGYAKGASNLGTGVITPTATALHADQQHEPQKALFVEGGKYCVALSIFCLTGIVLLGRPFITVWMGPALASCSGPSTILALGEILPMSQWIICAIVLGRNRHRVLACASPMEAFFVIAGGLILARRFGLSGVCLSIAIPGVLCRGALPIAYGCRLLDVSP